MIGTALFLLCATAVAHAEIDDSDIDGFYENGCPKDTSHDKLLPHENCSALFLLCATAIALADLEDTNAFFENGCPIDINIEKLLPHENCGQYYQCFRGALISRFCPNELLFNADLERCDWHAKCTKRVIINQTTFEELDTNNPHDAFLICSAHDSNNILVAHENCDEFYKCSHGRPVALKCAQTLLYNTLTEKCDMAKNVDCGERHFSEKLFLEVEEANLIENNKTTSDPSQAYSICNSAQSDGVVIAHEYCNMFYECSRGIPVPEKCSNRLWYDPIKEHCDLPMHVQCNGRIIPTYDDSVIIAANEEKSYDYKNNEISGDDDEGSSAIICAAKNSEGDVAAHENCEKFYKCYGNEPVAFKCPGNLLFNIKMNVCDWPNNVDCGNRIESRRVGTKEKKAHIICSAKGSNGVLATHQNCAKFYKCRDGLPVAIKCPGMLLYDPKTQKCKWQTLVNCTSRKLPKISNPPYIYAKNDNNHTNKESGNAHGDKSEIDNEIGYDANHIDSGNEHSNKNEVISNNVDSGHGKFNRYLSTAARICVSNNSEGILLPHENCDQYFKCFEGIAVTHICQLHLFYNIEKEKCDWQQNVNCRNRIVNENIHYGTEKSKFDESCTHFGDGTILPHENCSQFYKCVNGQKYAMECLQGLYYNTVLKLCDKPMNVDCGERLTEAEVRNQMGLP